MSLKAAIYARYSSDLQNQASIEDQVRICTERLRSEGWALAQCYSDAATSGASMMRPGIQELMLDALSGKFEVVICEALDRLSRDQEDIAGFYKRMQFAGVTIITLSEGEITSLHIGLKGTMNAMFLKDLADKTRRGLSGRVEAGKSGGGISYGYSVAKSFDAHGNPEKGEREINEEQAEIVKRIFEEYAYQNKSPKAIAADLNKDGIPCPSGKAWGQSTINGNRKRGTGILNNELYIGRTIWNRLRMVKNPDTGKRVSRVNDEKDWIIIDTPKLRILEPRLWDAAKARQRHLDKAKGSLHKTNRPQYLLSGLLKCGCCGGGYAKVNTHYYGCANAKNKGEAVCTNKLLIKREKLEGIVLGAIEERLMRGDMLELFCEEYTKHMNTLRQNEIAERDKDKYSLTKLKRKKAQLVESLMEGVPASVVKDELIDVANHIEHIEGKLRASQEPLKPFIHPSMAGVYKTQVRGLRRSFEARENDREISERIRTLVDKIVLTPKENEQELAIDLHGDIAGLIQLSNAKEKDMKDLSYLNQLDHISLNASQANQIDRIGSGGWI